MANDTLTHQGVVSIIPSMELPQLQNALAETEQECAVLATLKDKINSIKVTDASSYAELGQYVAQATSVKLIPSCKLGVFAAKVQRVKDWLRTEENKHVNLATEIIGIGKSKMLEYKRNEAQLALQEQNRINEQKRRDAEKKSEEDRKAREKEISKQVKAGDIGKREASTLRKQADVEAESTKNNVSQVVVKPNVPVVSGVVMRTNWKFEVINIEQLLEAYRREPAKYRKYIACDEVAIGQEVRRIKDKAEAEKAIPGIRVRVE